MTRSPVYVGCAGWKLGREYWPLFEGEGTHLERYASRLPAVEINSTFYRSHRPSTFAKWSASVDNEFRFSVKLPKSITHENRLQHSAPLLDSFLSECRALGEHLGCLLVQLPPSLTFEAQIAQVFFEQLRARYSGSVVIEPRHESWTHAHALLIAYQIAQVAVDPGRITGDQAPAGWTGIRYWRLHGSPRTYYSAYDADRLERLASQIDAIREEGVPTWCSFDNTARDAALGNALCIQDLLISHSG